MAVQILTVCGAGIGTSEILRVTAQRALQRLGIDATVTATDADHVRDLGDEVQVILATSEKVAAIGRTYAQIIVIENILDQAEVEEKLADALD
jgi:PTS system ascorbate-specific IIB component